MQYKKKLKNKNGNQMKIMTK